ncbi:MAG TPA: hypothetical protein ENN35_05655, partial [Deltaproteobacteria bacterium]|nr:hypothetical protein [Deltaproteobacteria bacterium]
PWPDIIVDEAVDNLSGSLTFITLPAGDGDIIFNASVRAKDMTVIAGGTVYIKGVSSYSVGGEAYSLWNSYTSGGVLPADGVIGATQRFPDHVDDILALEPSAVNLYGDKIYIDAEYLNINGIMQSGKDTYKLELDQDTIDEIDNLDSSQQGFVTLQTAKTSDFAVKFDTSEKQILVEEMNVSGGHIELTGHIMNTGTGEIRVLGGYADVEIINDTPYDLVVTRLDASQRGSGTLLINDKARDEVSLYRMSADNVIRTVDDGTVVNVDELSIDPASDIVDTYEPDDGWRYGWTMLQQQGTLYTLHKQTSSWLGIDAMAPDPGDEEYAVTEPLGQPTITGTGPYFYKDVSNTEDYTYEHDWRTISMDPEWTLTGKKVDSTWYGKKTYHSWWKKEEITEHAYTHTIESDRSFDIKFLGRDEGSVTIDSIGNVILQGPVLNPSGTTRIETDRMIKQTGESGLVNGLRIEVEAGSGIGSDRALDTNLADGPVYRYTSVYTGYPDDYEGDESKQGKTTLTTGDRVKLAADYAGGGEPGAVYRYIGDPADRDLRVENYADVGLWEKVAHRPSLSAVTVSGDIRINEIIGDLSVDQVKTGHDSKGSGGTVVLTTQGGIYVAQTGAGGWYGGLIQGGKIELTAENGGIGNSVERPLLLDSGTMLKDSVTAFAMSDVYLNELSGDLLLNKIDASGSDIYIKVDNGDILDVNQDAERDERTYNELKDGVWSDLQLTDSTGAQDKINTIVASFQATRQQEYRTYWIYRNTQPDPSVYDPDHRVTLSAADEAAYREFYAELGKTETEIDEAITTLENNRSEQYHTLHGQFDDYFTKKGVAFPGEYDPAFVYELNVVDPDEESTLRDSVKVWTEEELLYAIGAGLLKPVTDTQTTIEDPNIIGANVTLISSGGMGSSAGRIVIDLSAGDLHLTSDERVALSSAERDDVTYWGESSSSITVDFFDEGTADRIIRNDGQSWSAAGFAVGDKIRISGSADNDDYYLITAIDGDTITLSD